ncbi:MAG: hypothetical protein WC360_07810 [Opitutales bacterium]|jgi:hypothetical protein
MEPALPDRVRRRAVEWVLVAAVSAMEAVAGETRCPVVAWAVDVEWAAAWVAGAAWAGKRLRYRTIPMATRPAYKYYQLVA